MDLLEVLLDEDNREPIILMDEKGRMIEFEQVAVVPDHENEQLHVVLKPITEIEGIGDDEAIVFLVDFDEENNAVLRIEECEEVAIKVFEKYYELLEEARQKQGISEKTSKRKIQSCKKRWGRKEG